jgi:hypothetical protein
MHAAVSFGGSMWIVGGVGENLTPVNDIWRSADGAAWERVAASAPWTSRGFHSALVHNGRIWVVGGEAARASGASSLALAHDVWSSPDGVQWTRVAGPDAWPSGDALLHDALVHDGRIWVFRTPVSPSLTEVWSTSNGAEWTQSTSIGPLRSARPPRMMAVSHAGRIWVLGDTLVWSSEDGASWDRGALPVGWEPTAYATAMASSEGILVMGGTGGDTRPEVVAGNAVAFDPSEDLAYFATNRDRVQRVALGAGPEPPTMAGSAPLGWGLEWPESPGATFVWSVAGRSLVGPAELTANEPWLRICPLQCQQRLAGTTLSSVTGIGRGGEDFTRVAVDWRGANLYYYSFTPDPGRIVKMALPFQGSPSARVGHVELRPRPDSVRATGLGLGPGPDRLRAAGAAVLDPVHGFGYFGTARGGARADVVKVALGTRLQQPEIVGQIALERDETTLRSAVVDPAGGFAYFGGSTPNGLRGQVIKVALGEGASPPRRVGGVMLEADESDLQMALIDAADGYAYFVTGREPTRIVKIALGEGDQPPRRVGAVAFEAGASGLTNDVWLLAVAGR